MLTLEQSLADLVLRGVVTEEIAASRSGRPEQLLGLINRASTDTPDAPVASGLRVAGS
jgi:hypothetical protein